MDAVTEKRAVAQTEARSFLIAAAGRSRTGKTELLTVIKQLLEEDGTTVEAWDCDPVRESGALSQRIKGAKKSRTGDFEDRRIFLEEQAQRQMKASAEKRPFHAVLDLGGEDLLLPRMEGEVDFSEFLSRAGVALIVAHVVGTDNADLDYLRKIEKSKLIKAGRAAIVRNEITLRAIERRDAEFKRINEDPTVQAFASKERGGKLLWMPALPTDVMLNVKESGQTFREYSTDPNRAWDFRAVRVAQWLGACDAMRRELLG